MSADVRRRYINQNEDTETQSVSSRYRYNFNNKSYQSDIFEKLYKGSNEKIELIRKEELDIMKMSNSKKMTDHSKEIYHKKREKEEKLRKILKKFMSNVNKRKERKIKAAIIIQRCYRKYVRINKKQKEIRRKKEEKLRKIKEKEERRKRRKQRNEAAKIIQNQYKKHLVEKHEKENKSAYIIRKSYNNYKFKKYIKIYSKILIIQKAVRNFIQKKREMKEMRIEDLKDKLTRLLPLYRFLKHLVRKLVLRRYYGPLSKRFFYKRMKRSVVYIYINIIVTKRYYDSRCKKNRR